MTVLSHNLDPGILRGFPLSEIPRPADPPEGAGAFEDLFAGYLQGARSDPEAGAAEDRLAGEDPRVPPAAPHTETGGAASVGVSYDAETGVRSPLRDDEADDAAGALLASAVSGGAAAPPETAEPQSPGGEGDSGPAALPAEGMGPEGASGPAPAEAAFPGTGGLAGGPPAETGPAPEAPRVSPDSGAPEFRGPDLFPESDSPELKGRRLSGKGRAADKTAGQAAGPSPVSAGAPAETGTPAKAGSPAAPPPENPGPEALATAPAGAERRRNPGQDAEGLPLRELSGELTGNGERMALRAAVPEDGGADESADLSAEKSGEARRGGRRRIPVELRDYRGRPLQEAAAAGPSPLPASPENSGIELHPESFSPDTALAEPVPGEGGNRAGGTGAFEEILARELRQSLNGDIVRRAQVILRDGGEGIIRLSLKPESLGNVKIRLELTENKIAGRVIVESGEALRAFEREMASLEQAFRDSGYESADLSAFLAQDDRGSGGEGSRDRPFYSPRFAEDRAASRYDEALEKINPSGLEDLEPGFRPGIGSINMLV